MTQVYPELGAAFAPAAFAPGLFANAIQKTARAAHGMQIQHSDLTSAFRLRLDPGGTAALCRGWRYHVVNGGPRGSAEEHIREQLGYRGKWRCNDRWVDVELDLDADACPRVGEYLHLVPAHAQHWQLRCLAVTAVGYPQLKVPLLACHLTAEIQPTLGEGDPHVVGILPLGWVLLGGGSGIRMWVDENQPGRGHHSAVRLEMACDPIVIDSWRQSF